MGSDVAHELINTLFQAIDDLPPEVKEMADIADHHLDKAYDFFELEEPSLMRLLVDDEDITKSSAAIHLAVQVVLNQWKGGAPLEMVLRQLSVLSNRYAILVSSKVLDAKRRTSSV